MARLGFADKKAAKKAGDKPVHKCGFCGKDHPSKFAKKNCVCE